MEVYCQNDCLWYQIIYHFYTKRDDGQNEYKYMYFIVG